MCRTGVSTPSRGTLRLLDPAVGHGQLLLSLLREVVNASHEVRIVVCGFETDETAIEVATRKIRDEFPSVDLDLRRQDFLDFVVAQCEGGNGGMLFGSQPREFFDLIIANPPYVRTQIMGARLTQQLAENFNLTGRIDLYYPFILGISQVLGDCGTAGIIVSNRFMTTKSGEAVRRAISSRFNIDHVWDLGDTKLFQAAVLPAVLILRGKKTQMGHAPLFSSIYLTDTPGRDEVSDPIGALSLAGVVKTTDGRSFRVQHGTLSARRNASEPWHIATPGGDLWLARVADKTWGTFGDVGKIRVGVKTCADDVFIRSDWRDVCGETEPDAKPRPL